MSLMAGIFAGAAGTTALDIVTYLDMTVRGRPASVLPAQAAGKLADRAGVDLGSGGVAESRREGVGALLGYGAGLGVGGLYGLLAGDRRVPLPVAALGLSVAAMTAGAIPYTALRLTDPREWDASSWATDAVPHLVYGLTAAVVHRRLTRP
jgi:xanthosine utilization system XapX-like protein